MASMYSRNAGYARQPDYPRQTERDDYERDYDWDYSPRNKQERGTLERVGNEVRSWFGDHEAERRRRQDEFEMERHQRQGGNHNWNQPRSSSSVRASHVMTQNVATILYSDTIEQTARLMRDCDCGSLPVVNQHGRLIGMVTDRDIAMRIVARGINPQHAIVADCMTEETFACHANDDLDHCLQQMARHQIRRLPIVNDNDEVIGIISQADLARHAEAWQGRGQRRRLADTISEISAPHGTPYR